MPKMSLVNDRMRNAATHRPVNGVRNRTNEYAADKQARWQHLPTFVPVDGEGLETKCQHKSRKRTEVTSRIAMELSPTDCTCLEYSPASDKVNADCTCKHNRFDHYHAYVLFAVGQELIENENGLPWWEIFEFLYRRFIAEGTDKVYAGFYLGYDFAQILKGISFSRAVTLLYDDNQDGTLHGVKGVRYRKRNKSGGNPTPFPVDLTGPDGVTWEIDMLAPTRRLKLRPMLKHAPGDIAKCIYPHSPVYVDKETGQVKGGKHTWMYVCDAGPFFQSSFLKAIDPKNYREPIVTQEEYETIKAGKERRTSHKLDDEMRRYTRLENELLARLLSVYAEGLQNLGIKLRASQWYGPGQAAQEWLYQQAGMPTSKTSLVPENIQAIALATYYGGWFEIFAHGHIPGDTWEYDINSAYPHIMAELPCFEHGTWKRGKNRPKNNGLYRMVKATVLGNDPYIGPVPYRDAAGGIMHPQRVRSSWYWQHEILAAQKAGLIEEIYYEEWYEYHPCDCAPPMAGLTDLYNKRRKMGKDTAIGIAAKLVYNSVYGKNAQTKGEAPPFRHPVYASLITAGCRAMILDAIATHPEGSKAVTMIATDAVYFRSPHPTLSCCETPCQQCCSGTHCEMKGDEECQCGALGYWEGKKKVNLLQLMPGVYWDDKARASKEPKYKSRGVNPKYLWRKRETIEVKFGAWKVGEKCEWPEETFPLDMSMISAYEAIRSLHKWELCGTMRKDAKRKLSADPSTKRQAEPFYDLEYDMWRTRPYFMGPDNGGRSAPYNPKTSRLPMVDGEAEGINPDGPSSMLLAEAFSLGNPMQGDD